MKKIVMFLGIVLFSFFGCKDKSKPVISNPVNPNQACKEQLILAIADSSSLTNNKIAELLKDCGSIVCENEALLSQIEGIHKMNSANNKVKYNNYLQAFWGSLDKVEFKSYKWADIKVKLENKCYDEYLTFNYDDEKDSLIELTSKVPFTDYPSCYSIPLLKSIELNYRIKNSRTIPDTAIFKFAKGKYNNKTIILFETNDAIMGVSNYDMSDIPLNNPSPLLKLIRDIYRKL